MAIPEQRLEPLSGQTFDLELNIHEHLWEARKPEVLHRLCFESWQGLLSGCPLQSAGWHEHVVYIGNSGVSTRKPLPGHCRPLSPAHLELSKLPHCLLDCNTMTLCSDR